jgi:predicted RNase H-like HicB family nuclease
MVEKDVEEMTYAVIFEKAPSNWCAYVPDLPRCVTIGKTLEETRRLTKEAIQFHLEGLRLHGYPVA